MICVLLTFNAMLVPLWLENDLSRKLYVELFDVLMKYSQSISNLFAMHTHIAARFCCTKLQVICKVLVGIEWHYWFPLHTKRNFINASIHALMDVLHAQYAFMDIFRKNNFLGKHSLSVTVEMLLKVYLSKFLTFHWKFSFSCEFKKY